jgi:ubiquinone/menaquinone biosynthesis C-methylase UbiE
VSEIAAGNLEAQEAWDGVLFDRFLQYRDAIVPNLAAHGDEAIRLCPPEPGDRILDIGCGFGDSTQQLARLVGPAGSALGVDIAPRFVERARLEAELAGVENARFEVHDVEAATFDETFDYAFSRFGAMFFANPVRALRNVREAIAPGGRLCIVVWRRKVDNPWVHVAENVVKPLLAEPEETDEALCGPGPFSMADADTTSGELRSAGFDEITLRRYDRPLRLGSSLEEAVELNLALGPAAEALRLAGEDGAAMRPQLEAVLREALAQFVGEDGSVEARSSTWIVTARSPAARYRR